MYIKDDINLGNLNRQRDLIHGQVVFAKNNLEEFKSRIKEIVKKTCNKLYKE